MAKILSAKEKAIELGISMRALAKTRHLYRHIPKSPRKFLYFEEEPKEAVRPFTPEGSDGSVKSRSNRRRNVPFGQENYHKAPGGSGNSLQTLNQMRAKASLEGKIKPEELHYLDEAMATNIKENAKEIVERKRLIKGQEVDRETERIRETHFKNRLSGVYNCSDSGRRYPYTLTQFYDQKEKIMGPSTDALVGDRIRRAKKIDTSFHLTGKPYSEHLEHHEDDKPWWQKD